ncbi:MAG TPA: hypothetical protein ENG88_04505, partial [Nitrospirae bacterium]|nr:hypothetical protein [Nitrospirota bacterium]
MIVHVSRYIILFITVLTLGCGSNTGVVKRTDVAAPVAAPQSETVNNEDNDSPLIIPLQEEVVVDDVNHVKEEPLVNDSLVLTKEENEEKQQNMLDTALDFCNASQEYWSEGNLTEAIQALDNAYMLVMQVHTEENPELIQQKEDLRFMISKRILEIYASRY